MDYGEQMLALHRRKEKEKEADKLKNEVKLLKRRHEANLKRDEKIREDINSGEGWTLVKHYCLRNGWESQLEITRYSTLAAFSSNITTLPPLRYRGSFLLLPPPPLGPPLPHEPPLSCS